MYQFNAILRDYLRTLLSARAAKFTAARARGDAQWPCF